MRNGENKLTIRNIKIFLAVCENNNNVTKAAKKLYLTQPAVTVAIHDIEKYYGILLFDRISKKLYLTESGKLFKTYAQRICSLFDDMEKDLKNGDNPAVLRIGASITIGSQFMPGYVEDFCRSYPTANVRVMILPSNMLEKKLVNSELDFALVETPVHEKSLTAHAYMEDCLAVITPAKAPFRPGQVLSKEKFMQQSFLLMEKGSGTRETFEQTMQKAGMAVNPVWEGMSTSALINAVIHGLGIAVVPKRMATDVIQKKLVYEVTVDGIEFKRYFYIVYHKDKLLTKPFMDFINMCKNCQS